MKPPGAATHAATVREFLTIIAAQAKAALNGIDKSGLLQLSRLHPSDEDGSPVPTRHKLGDTERMIETAIADSENGHNVYIEGRTVCLELRGKQRGGFEDTVATFAYTVDGDADKGMGGAPLARVSLTVETSPGNFHHWFFLKEAITDWRRAKALGDRIRAAVGADHDTGTITQPYRVAGTVNYPGPKKLVRGRVTVPTKIIEFDPEALWTAEELEQAFPAPERKADAGTRAPPPAGAPDESSIPADTMRVICDGVPESMPKKDRSFAFFNVIVVLKQDGWTVDGIAALLEKYPGGIAAKYVGRLRHEVERSMTRSSSVAHRHNLTMIQHHARRN
jgi:hypothetical protein